MNTKCLLTLTSGLVTACRDGNRVSPPDQTLLRKLKEATLEILREKVSCGIVTYTKDGIEVKFVMKQKRLIHVVVDRVYLCFTTRIEFADGRVLSTVHLLKYPGNGSSSGDFYFLPKEQRDELIIPVINN